MSMRKCAVLSVAIAITALIPAPADAATIGRTSAPGGHHGQVCRQVHARGVGEDLGGGRTTATIFRHRVRVGTSEATFSEGAPDANGVVPFQGPIVLTLGAGTLTVQVAGTFDITNGHFVARSSSINGSGQLAGVSGRLTFRGVEDLTTFMFTEKIKGRLCASQGS